MHTKLCPVCINTTTTIPRTIACTTGVSHRALTVHDRYVGRVVSTTSIAPRGMVHRGRDLRCRRYHADLAHAGANNQAPPEPISAMYLTFTADRVVIMCNAMPLERRVAEVGSRLYMEYYLARLPRPLDVEAPAFAALCRVRVHVQRVCGCLRCPLSLAWLPFNMHRHAFSTAVRGARRPRGARSPASGGAMAAQEGATGAGLSKQWPPCAAGECDACATYVCMLMSCARTSNGPTGAAGAAHSHQQRVTHFRSRLRIRAL